MKVFQGTLKLDAKAIIFQHGPAQEVEHISLLPNRQKQSDLLLRKWPIASIRSVQARKYLLKPHAVELFLKDRTSVFLCLKSAVACAKLMDHLHRSEQKEVSKGEGKTALTEQWCKREISTLEYLMSLNALASRTNCDLNQYFVFPWVMGGHKRSRDLERNMGCQGSGERKEKFIETFIASGQEFVAPHHFGCHYSNIGIVLQYLVRVLPFAEGAAYLQGGKFDLPDRLFTSFEASY